MYVNNPISCKYNKINATTWGRFWIESCGWKMDMNVVSTSGKSMQVKGTKMTKRFLLAALVLIATFAVADTGSISGVVADQSGAIVAGAEISVVNTDTGAVHKATSANSGIYSVPDLPAG